MDTIKGFFSKKPKKQSTESTSHESSSSSRVVTVRETFQTTQSINGQTIDRKIVVNEKHDTFESEAQQSPLAKRFQRPTPNSIETAKADDFNLKTFIDEVLRCHNEYRRKHGAPDLKLNKKLCSVSQEWADTLSKEDRFAHRPNSKYGENIYCYWSSDPRAMANPRDVCRSWYDEIKDHEFNVEPRGSMKSGHFTQLVWKSSQDLGVGVSKTKKGKVLVVCNYDPPGNFVGRFSTNVLKAR